MKLKNIIKIYLIFTIKEKKIYQITKYSLLTLKINLKIKLYFYLILIRKVYKRLMQDSIIMLFH